MNCMGDPLIPKEYPFVHLQMHIIMPRIRRYINTSWPDKTQ